MNHPHLRNNERQISLSVCLVTTAERICFILPGTGDTIEYMAIDKGQPGFDEILEAADRSAEEIEKIRREKKVIHDRETRYQLYLRLKDEFASHDTHH